MLVNEWRQIPGHPNYYACSDGQIAGPSGIKRLKPWANGYLVAWIDKRSMLVARLILLTFIGPAPAGYEASHLDGNSQNNCLDNLRWESHLDNMRRKHEHGTVVRGERMNTAKLVAEQVVQIRKMRDEGRPCREIAEEFGIAVCTVSQIATRRSWKHVA